MDSLELAFAGPLRQAELIRAGEVSPRELVQLYLDRIERIDPHLNAFRVVMGERALAEAEQAEARRSQAADRPFLGVPFAVKDNQDVAGEVTTHGTNAYDPQPARQDAEVVRRLRAAGAIPIGKTLLPELAICGFTESAAWGITRNPWDTDRTPGGSSGGSAAAVAAGLASFATASDGAGSIRIPAANCRIFGLKPQRGRVSLMPDSEHWHGLSVAGVHTVAVADQAALLDAIAGPADGDADPAPAWERPLAGAAAAPPPKLRIATSTKPAAPGVPVSAESRRAVEEIGELLRSLGHEVRPYDPDYGLLATALFPRYTNGIRQDAQRMARPGRLERRTRGFARWGAFWGPLVERARRSEGEHARRIFRVFDEHDVLITPVTARPPVEVMRWEGLGATRTLDGMTRVYPYAATWNMLGNPAAAVPSHLTADGLPVAVQLVARPHDEHTIVALAAQIEAERPWADPRPPVAAGEPEAAAPMR
jgi:amidase